MKRIKLANKKYLFLVVVIFLVVFVLISKYNEERATEIQPDYSDSRTIKDNDKSIIINFRKCTQDKMRKDVGLGSTTIAVFGKSGDLCVMRYGSEVENPNWDGKLSFKCLVPQSIGELEFTTTSFSVDFKPIEKYCSK